MRLLGDTTTARIRRQAALAIGRVGLPEGVPPLVKLLADPDPEVRQMAAFALGLIGDPSARDPLVGALRDPSPLVKGSAAEALGLIGDRSAADAVGQMAAEIVQSGAAGSDARAQTRMRVRDTPVGALRLALFALVRLNAYDQLAAAVLDGAQPRVRWWPVAFALAASRGSAGASRTADARRRTPTRTREHLRPRAWGRPRIGAPSRYSCRSLTDRIVPSPSRPFARSDG